MHHINHPSSDIHLRSANKADLAGINQVIESAIDSWDLPERVKRLSLPSYRYSEIDAEHLTMMVAENNDHLIIGVITWEPAETKDLPDDCYGLLIHGIYLKPAYHRQGIGRLLFSAAEDAVRSQHIDGLLVKAQKNAESFFEQMGMQRLAINDANRQYANRFWKKI